MDLIIEFGPWLATMAVLVCFSGFFSCSEAALFYLRRQDRRTLQSGNPAQRIAAALLEDPDRLLTAHPKTLQKPPFKRCLLSSGLS